MTDIHQIAETTGHPNADLLVEIEHVVFGYDASRTILNDVSLSFGRGKVTAILGGSGCGKTTLLRLIGGVHPVDRGTIRIDGDLIGYRRKGNKLHELREREILKQRSRIGFVFQNFNLLARTSALENVELPLLYSEVALTNAELRSKAEQVLSAVGLQGRGDHTPSQLSGGQQQRVAIARALINDPEVLLADEPTGNLDSRTSVEVMEIFQSLNEKGITIIMVTHEPDIASYARRNIVMKDGLVRDDILVQSRLNAASELKKLSAADALEAAV